MSAYVLLITGIIFACRGDNSLSRFLGFCWFIISFLEIWIIK